MRYIPPDAIEIDTKDIRDLRPLVLDADGRMRVLPQSFWDSTTTPERLVLGHHAAAYLFPTIELVEYLQHLIGDRTAIEIGSGNGVLAEAVGIRATDTREQETAQMQLYFRAIAQVPITYGHNVAKVEANRAVKVYRPQVVIASWVTQDFNPRTESGKPGGVREGAIIDHCEEYVLIGHENVHAGKDIWSRPHEIEYPPFVVSRGRDGGRNFIARFRRP